MAVNGKYLVIKKNGAVIAGTRSNDIGSECEMIPVSSPASGVWKTYRSGRKGWTCTVNFLLMANADAEALLNVGNVYSLTLTDGTTTYVGGQANLAVCRITATIGNLVQGTFQFVGNGALTSSTSSQ